MNAKIVGIVVLVVLLLGGIIAVSRNKKSTPVQETQIQNTLTFVPTAMISKEQNQKYTMAQVKKHNIETDCWLVIEGKVYDATSFIPTHPGGKAILNGCGKDATGLFNERPTNNKGPHPATARAALEKLYIGDLEE